MAHNIQLILGGSNSGKTRYALNQTELAVMRYFGKPTTCYYLATYQPQPNDKEMAQKILNHQTERNSRAPHLWQTKNIVIELPQLLQQTCQNPNPQFMLLDSVSMWLFNIMLQVKDISTTIHLFLTGLQQWHQTPHYLTIVSDEISLAPIASDELTRHYQQQLGQLNQAIANIADQVDFVIAGLPLNLKSSS